MESEDIFKKIREIGQSINKRDGEFGQSTNKLELNEKLRQYCNLQIEEILINLPRKILSSDGAHLIDFILKGLSGQAQKKSQVIDIVLKSLRKEPMPLTYCGDVVSRLSLELPKLPIESLLKWSNDSVQTIIDNSDVNMLWRDILPECLNIMTSTHPVIKHCGTEMSSIEYKIQCIHTLCHCTWKEKQLIQLTAMFQDIPLTKESHKQAVNKICSYIINLPPDTLPPLVHQLLKLCKQHNLEIVLCHLSHYFSLRLYSKLDPPPQDSESTTMDIEDIVQHSEEELSHCLSTCLYHLSQGLADPELIRKHIRQWPKTQILRAPFLIDVALAVSDKGGDFRSACLDVIKLAIELRLQDELRSNESAWAGSVLPLDVDIASVLKALVTGNSTNRQLTVLGLINLSFSLLSVLRSKPTAHQCWALGQMILVKLCRAQPETTSHILSQLSDKLVGDNTQSQYSDCLYVLCKQAPVPVERCSEIVTLIESCQGPDAFKTYEALRPLLPFSEKTRDTLLKVCRKYLYSGDSVHRCLSVSGFLSVLQYTRLSSWSESSQPSSHSYFSQLTVDVHPTQGATVTSRVQANENLFLEIVSILRRCFVQDVTVKQHLYTEIYASVKNKKALHESILEMLNEHLSKYLPEDDEGSILLGKCVANNGDLIEPIGQLLFTIAQFLQVQEDESDDILDSECENPVIYYKNKLTTIMQKLCQADWLALVDLAEPLSDLTVESKIQRVKVQQILQSYEALIAHTIMQWNLLNANANSVLRLHKAYSQVVDNTKSSPKATKKAKANDTKDATTSQKSVTDATQKKRDKSPVTFASTSKNKAEPFKPLPCVWDLQFGLRVLELLYGEEVSWSSSEQRNQVRSQRSFNVFAVRAVQGVVTDKLNRQQVATNVLKIAGLMYTRCIIKFQDVYNFDKVVMFACLELFKSCLNLLLSNIHAFKTEFVLLGLTGVKDTTESAYLAEILGALYTSLEHLEKESEDDGLDAIEKKTYSILVQICVMFMDVPVKACHVLSETLAKLESLCRRSNVTDIIVLSAGCLTASARDDQDAPLLDHMLKRMAIALGYNCDEESLESQDTLDFPSIDEKTGHTALPIVCTHLLGRLKCTEHLLQRAKDLNNAIEYTPQCHHHRIKRDVKDLYESVQVQLCQMTSWSTRVAKLRCCIGSSSDKVLSLCERLYSLLAAYIKQLDLNMAQTLHLEKLLKLSGRKLSHVVDGLVLYVEASQQQKNVLRYTRLIPPLVKNKEHFHSNVMMLGQKSYQQYISLGSSRDFKIVKPTLEDKLNALESNTQQTEEIVDDDASTVVLGNSSEGLDLNEQKRKKRRSS